jgi:hypothetical protein
MGDPQNHRFQYYNNLILVDLGYPHFRKLPHERRRPSCSKRGNCMIVMTVMRCRLSFGR